MPEYRLYRLDGAGKIDSADWIEASADGGAVREARKRFGQRGFELWQGKRLVCREQGARP